MSHTVCSIDAPVCERLQRKFNLDACDLGRGIVHAVGTINAPIREGLQWQSRVDICGLGWVLCHTVGGDPRGQLPGTQIGLLSRATSSATDSSSGLRQFLDGLGCLRSSRLPSVWLSSGSSRSWILQALTEPCAWSLGMTLPSMDLGLLVDAHALAEPSSRHGADVFFRR